MSVLADAFDPGMLIVNAGAEPPPSGQEDFQGLGQTAQGRFFRPWPHSDVEIVLTQMPQGRLEPGRQLMRRQGL